MDMEIGVAMNKIVSQPEGRTAEFGSFNVNGTVRILFDCDHYVGIDWIAGPCVDVVSLAHEVNFQYQFDTIITASMPFLFDSIP